MTELLVSVRNVEEAKIASQFEIGILDVKEPKNGALGAAESPELDAIANDPCCDHLTKSFAIGEILDWLNADEMPDKSRIPSISAVLKKYDFVKAGTAGLAKRNQWRSVVRQFWETISNQAQSQIVAVAYLDWETCDAPPANEIVEFASSQRNCNTILFDTYGKTNDLFHCQTGPKIKHLIDQSKNAGLKTVLAGSINLNTLETAIRTGPELIGVRGAVCQAGREGKVQPKLVFDFLNKLNELSHRQCL